MTLFHSLRSYLVVLLLFLTGPVLLAGAVHHPRSDFYGNGTSDLLWRNGTTGQVFMMPMSGGVVQPGSVFWTEPNPAWQIVGTGDFDGDGKADILWWNSSTGQVFQMLMNGSTIKTFGVIYTEPNTAWTIQAVADFDGDGKADILWRNSSTGQVYLMPMNGAAVLPGTIIWTEPNPAWQIVGTGDFDGDGKADILWWNSSTGQVFQMLMNGSAVKSSGIIYTEPNTSWKVVGTGDFNSDGKTDVLWRNSTTGQVYLMPMNGATVLPGAIIWTEPNMNWQILAIGDFDGDGRDDIVWRNSSTGQVFQMLMNGSTVNSSGLIYAEPNTTWALQGEGVQSNQAVNHAPMITSAPLTNATGGQPYTYFIYAIDPDGDAITYQLVSGPSGAVLNGNALSWTPSPAQERTPSSFTITARDARGAISTPQSWTVTPTGTVEGSSIITYLPLDWMTRTITPTSVPNPGPSNIGAVVPNGSGGYTTLNGSYSQVDGNYSIAGVPGGKYWLTYNNIDFIWTDKSQVDLGWTVSGRKDQTTAAISPTNVVFSVTNMNPWNGNDYLEFYDFNSNSYENLNYYAYSSYPVAGDTALAGMTVDWAATYSRHLTDMTKGDAPQLIQMVTQTSGATSYQVAKKRFNPAGLTMVDGVGTTVAGAFADIPLTSSFMFNWKGSAFAQYAGAVTPYGTPALAYMVLVGTPGRSAYGTANSLDLLYFYQDGAPADLNLGPLPIPAMPVGFEASCLAEVQVNRSFKLPAATTGTSAAGVVWTETNSLPTANTPLLPVVSPVQYPTIGGQAIANDVSGVGVQPILSWIPPVLGTPTGYVVALRHLTLSGTSTKSTTIARLYTDENSVTVPPGLMTPGEAYYLLIRAFASPGWDPGLSPYRSTKPIPMGCADFISGIIRP
jgi:hypothetical protein